jgi:superfamily II DNA/RNA helicase
LSNLATQIYIFQKVQILCFASFYSNLTIVKSRFTELLGRYLFVKTEKEAEINVRIAQEFIKYQSSQKLERLCNFLKHQPSGQRILLFVNRYSLYI